MGIQAAEISAILKDQIKNFGQEAEVALGEDQQAALAADLAATQA